MNNVTFKFQKDYFFVNNGKPADIVLPNNNIEYRVLKLQKIMDRLNNVNHVYKEYLNSDIDYFRHVLAKYKISNKVRCSLEKIVKNYE